MESEERIPVDDAIYNGQTADLLKDGQEDDQNGGEEEAIDPNGDPLDQLIAREESNNEEDK